MNDPRQVPESIFSRSILRSSRSPDIQGIAHNSCSSFRRGHRIQDPPGAIDYCEAVVAAGLSYKHVLNDLELSHLIQNEEGTYVF